MLKRGSAMEKKAGMHCKYANYRKYFFKSLEARKQFYKKIKIAHK